MIKTFLKGLIKGISGCAVVLALVLGICYLTGMADWLKPGFGRETASVEIPEVQVVEPESSQDMENAEALEEPEERPAEPEEEEPIRLLFAGDLFPTELLLEKYNKNGISAAATPELLEKLKGADIFMLNQEFPFGTTGEAMEEKEYTFRVPPKYAALLKELGADVVTLANNHMLDFGRGPLGETLETLDEAGILHVGAGRNLGEAKACQSIEVQGRRIGFLGASRVIPDSSWMAASKGSGLFATYDPKLLLEEIQAAKAENDYVVVYVHWGIERNTEPEDYQKSLARAYIDAGADAVIGSHPHVLQGMEFYKEKPIFYSLGNFIFSNRDYETMLAELTLTEKSVEVRLIPCKSIRNQMDLKALSGEFCRQMEALSFGVSVEEDGRVVEE